MVRKKLIMFIFLLLLSGTYKALGEPFRQICYMTNWAQYRPGSARFLPAHIDSELCTHFVYAFAKIDKNLRVSPYEWNDIAYNNLYQQFNNIKIQNSKAKTLIGIGGWNHPSYLFTSVVRNRNSRKAFIADVIQYARQYDFDGVDIDWEYPTKRGSPLVDRARFSSLVEEMRQAFEREPRNGQPRLILSAAIGVGYTILESAYDISRLAKSVDMLNLMTYDLWGPWNGKLGCHAPLHKQRGARGLDAKLNVDWIIGRLDELGAPRHKLNMGIPFHGKSFSMCSTRNFRPGSVSCGTGAPDRYTRARGFMAYYEVLAKLQAGWQSRWDSTSQCPYAYDEAHLTWITYDDTKSVALKTKYAFERGLGGVMLWALDLDDFADISDLGQVYPLLHAVKKTIQDLTNRRVGQIRNETTAVQGWRSSTPTPISSIVTQRSTMKKQYTAKPPSNVMPKLNVDFFDKTDVKDWLQNIFMQPRKDLLLSVADESESKQQQPELNLENNVLQDEQINSFEEDEIVAVAPNSTTVFYSHSTQSNPTSTHAVTTPVISTSIKKNNNYIVKYMNKFIKFRSKPKSSINKENRFDIINLQMDEPDIKDVKPNVSFSTNSSVALTTLPITKTQVTRRVGFSAKTKDKESLKAARNWIQKLQWYLSKMQHYGNFDIRALSKLKQKSKNHIKPQTDIPKQHSDTTKQIASLTSPATTPTVKERRKAKGYDIVNTITSKDQQVHDDPFVGIDRNSLQKSLNIPKVKPYAKAKQPSERKPWKTVHGYSKVFTCERDFGLFADPMDCTRFYHCSWSVPIRYNCPARTSWRQEYLSCDWSINGCVSDTRK